MFHALDADKMSLFSCQENDTDHKRCEPRQGNATGWNSESTTFDLANHFTHNPRLMSPSSFRTPPKVPSYSGDLISVDMEINSCAFNTQRSDVRTSTPNSQSPTSSSPGGQYLSSKGQITSSIIRALTSDDDSLSPHSLTPNVDRTFRVEDDHFSPQDHSISPEQFFSPEDRSVSKDHPIFSPDSQTYSPSVGNPFSPRSHSFSPRGQTMSLDDSPASPQGQTVSPAGQTSSHRGQTSSPEGQFSTSIPHEDRESTKPGDESGISLFSETRFNTSGENSEDEDEQKSISDCSDGSSSKLNWSLSASYSSSAASISDSERRRSLSDNSDGSLSSAVCARRRRRRRNLSLSSPSTASEDGTQVINSASYFRDCADDEGALTFSQCSQEVSHILTRAPVAMVTLRDQDAIRHSPIKFYDGYHRRPRGEVMNWDEFESPGKVYPKPPVKRKHLTPFYPHGNSSCNASHCLQNRRKRGFKKSSKIAGSRHSSPEVPSASYDKAWPALPRRVSPQTTSLLNDPAILSVGKAIQNRGTQLLPQKDDIAMVDSRSVDSKRTFLYENVSRLSQLLNSTCGQQSAHPNISSTNQHTKVDTVLQDPAVLRAYRQNDSTNSTIPYRILENRSCLPPQQEGCRCRTMPIADDPAILDIGTPMYSIYAGVPTHIAGFEYCYYFG
ncbi:uncharacterized protein LOC119731127 [Patiria miniata]|uniref:Uncharacterized protein n=1 Tax=Patiria miniata TaxID=46514 RepID=A0A914A9G4_PATMI|nr:uncharacterized protein LOC119731127 [Patiria miniata]